MTMTLDSIARNFEKPASTEAYRQTYDLGRTPTEDDLRTLRLRLAHRYSGYNVDVRKDVTDTVTVTISLDNERGWTHTGSAPVSLSSYDSILSRRHRSRA
jgi:hypothetical protein